MKSNFYQKIIYQLVSQLIIFPIYKFLFRGILIGRENIPKKGSFILVSNHGSLLDPAFIRSCCWSKYIFYGKVRTF